MHTDGDVVVVINHDEVTELQMTSSASCLARNALHGAAVAEEAVRVVVYEVVAGLVKDTGSMGLRHRQSYRICETLAQGTSRDFDALGVVSLRMTWANAINFLQEDISLCTRFEELQVATTYTERLEVIHADSITKEVKNSILKHAAVAVSECADVSGLSKSVASARVIGWIRSMEALQ